MYSCIHAWMQVVTDAVAKEVSCALLYSLLMWESFALMNDLIVSVCLWVWELECRYPGRTWWSVSRATELLSRLFCLLFLLSLSLSARPTALSSQPAQRPTDRPAERICLHATLIGSILCLRASLPLCLCPLSLRGHSSLTSHLHSPLSALTSTSSSFKALSFFPSLTAFPSTPFIYYSTTHLYLLNSAIHQDPKVTESLKNNLLEARIHQLNFNLARINITDTR